MSTDRQKTILHVLSQVVMDYMERPYAKHLQMLSSGADDTIEYDESGIPSDLPEDQVIQIRVSIVGSDSVTEDGYLQLLVTSYVLDDAEANADVSASLLIREEWRGSEATIFVKVPELLHRRGNKGTSRA